MYLHSENISLDYVIRKQNQVNMDHLKIVLSVICLVFQLALIENLID